MSRNVRKRTFLYVHPTKTKITVLVVSMKKLHHLFFGKDSDQM